MKKGIIIPLIVVLCIVALTATSCVPTNTPAATTQTESPITTLQNWKTAMETWKTATADPAIAKINAMQQSNVSQADISGLESTLTQLQADLNSATSRLTTAENDIKDLKEAVNNSTSTSGGINSGGTTGGIPQFTPGTPPSNIPTSATGSVVSQIAFISGQSQIYTSVSGSNNNVWYIQRLINESTAIQYVRPLVNLSMQSGYNYSPTVIGAMYVSMSSSQCIITGEQKLPTGYGTANPWDGWPSASSPISALEDQATGTVNIFSVAPAMGVQTNNALIMPIGGCTGNAGEFYISPGGYVDVTVMIQSVYTQAPVLWNVSPTFSSHP